MFARVDDALLVERKAHAGSNWILDGLLSHCIHRQEKTRPSEKKNLPDGERNVQPEAAALARRQYETTSSCGGRFGAR